MLAAAHRQDLADMLVDARARSLALTSDLSDEQLRVPLMETINPFVWEMGHIAFFSEFWTLRHLYGEPPIIANADQLYDSAKIPHDDRWSLPLPTREQTLAFMRSELERAVTSLERGRAGDKDIAYFYRLVVHHEDMHDEAFIYTRQTLAYPRPRFAAGASAPAGGALPGDVHGAAGVYRIGAEPHDGFVFDNEKWAHEVEIADFDIARAPVTNVQFAAFVADGGYRERRHWSDDGWAWRERANACHPLYWRPVASGNGSLAWERRHFDAWRPLAEHQPVVHVSWFEAEAYCRWAGRRLPTEAEWEIAATGGVHQRYPWGECAPQPEHANLDASFGDVVDVAAFAAGDSPVGCRQMIGNVWEWTATPFGPYPGFSPDPYEEYSAPWFGSHMVLRGGAWSTRSRLVTNRWRNFYRPHRQDIITGFRTCARRSP